MEAKNTRAEWIAKLKTNPNACKHVLGHNYFEPNLSEDSRVSIITHLLDTKVLVGICTRCQRDFLPEDEDYIYWISRAMNSENVVSTAAFKTIPATEEELKEQPWKDQFCSLDGYPDPEWNREETKTLKDFVNSTTDAKHRLQGSLPFLVEFLLNKDVKWALEQKGLKVDFKEVLRLFFLASEYEDLTEKIIVNTGSIN